MKCLKVFVLLVALTVPGWAQDSGDAPDHGVARISVLGGDVSVRRGDTGEFVAAELNAPLVALDHVLTEENSRAEIQLDWANFVRLAAESEVRLAELKDRDFLVQVAAGTVTFRVLRDSQAQVEISTPTVAIRPRQQGTYRITVRDDFSTELTVRSGEAEIFAGGKSDFVRAGQTLLVSGDPADPQRSYLAAIPRDDFDRWNDARDRDLDRGDSYKYVSRDIYGAEDLAGYGRWVYDAPYGWVWVPTVSVSWAPYRVGRWTWVNYYGWTWVSGDPWGWAPYHYGNWYHTPRYGWVWYPGATHVRYYWRPALVGFFGWGVNIGWVALAPHEVYRPWYGRAVVTNVTYINNINVLNTYRNARYISGRSGVTSIVAGNFGRRITINNFVVANDNDLKRAGDARRWLPHEPSRENRQYADRPVSPRVNTKRDFDRRFVSTRPEWNDRDRRQPSQGQARPADNIRRVDAAPRNDRNDTDRGRQPESNPGRGQNAAPPVAASRPDNGRGAENPRRNESVASPRNDTDRGRQPEGNRGRSETPAPVVAGNRSDNGRRNENPVRNESVTFPRNDADRGRQPEGNSGRGNSGNTVASRPSEPARRAEVASSPRQEPERTRQAEINSGRAPAFARPQPEPARPAPAQESFRRAPAEARPSIDPAPQRQQEPQPRPGRFPGVEREQPRENPRPAPGPAPRAESPRVEPPRVESPRSAPPPQASSPAPSPSPSRSPSGNSSEGNGNSGGNGRGRDRR